MTYALGGYGIDIPIPWGRRHDIENLFIVDGLIFPAAGAVNPTSTIQAMALYVGDRIKTNIETLFD